MRLIPIVAVAVLAVQLQSASAVLMLTITGSPGSGQTNWAFSGTSEAGGPGLFDGPDDNLFSNDAWDIGSDVFPSTSNDREETPSFSSGTLTIESVTRNIDLAYIDHDASGALDDIGVSVDGPDNFAFVAADEISWAGFMTVPIDVNDMMEAGLPFTKSITSYGGTPGTLALDISISAVPEPSSFAFLSAFASLGVILSKRRMI